MDARTADSNREAGARTSLRSSSRLGWQGFGAELLAISAGQHRIPAADHHRIGVHVGSPVRANCACDGRHVARLQAHGDADVVPAGLDGVWTDDADCTILRIWFEEPFVRTIAEQLDGRRAGAQIWPRLQLRDPRLQYLAWTLQAELEAGEVSDPLFAQSIGTAIVVRLLDGASLSRGRRSMLGARAAARVTDYIEACLDQRLTLDELAALVDMSVPHFKVLFRETLGLPVHQYIVRRRVERARALLVEGELSLSQIALEAGFAHQSHMAHWMNRLLGLTPREIVRNSK
ncbi:helix-turn-helix transcriptional regulator [Paraburkholderia sp. B3]|uniref:helix-turn-helix transcriptional regulator n=1 Tax=Paraburkholderia sp. B3 TaxID=3134791 RepID=UPI0039819D78